MKAELILNDLSVIEAPSNDIARGWFTETFKAVAELIHQDVCRPLLHAQIELTDILLTDDYGFDEWLEELEYHDDLRLLAQKLNTDTPVNKFLKIIETENDEFCRSEFHLKTEIEPKRACDALGVALISDGISLNLPSNSEWCLPFIEIEQTLYGEFEELKPEKVVYHRVRSVSKFLHVDPVVRDWRRNIGERSNNTDELLEHWKTAFPYLDLCVEYRDKFLPALKGNTFKSVIKRLYELDDSCHVWTKEISYPMYARPESKETMKKNELANMRLATCPDNGETHFVMHCDIQPKGYRLYWFENRKKKRLTIGYAGTHLKTIKFKAQ